MDGLKKTIKFDYDESSNRISTGIQRLDEKISGGLPRNSITLISGTPGSGKTILCYHYLMAGLTNGENCLYLTSDERVNNILKQAYEVGFDFREWVDKEKLTFLYLDLDNINIHREIDEKIKSGNYSRVVLDSLTPVAEIPVWVNGIHEIIPSKGSNDIQKFPTGSVPAMRMHVRRILNILNQENCTSIITSEIPEGSRSLSRDSISEFLVDGIIILDLDITMDRRKLTIRKMRATNHTLKPQEMKITEEGIKLQ
jgi:circadian clock protein KaiC